MSHIRLLVLLAAAGVSGLLGGCCGGAPSHKCNFTPLPSQVDAGGDMAMPCGTLGPCSMGQVCCYTRIAPYAECIDPSNFKAYNCETPPSSMPNCLVPKDCDAGAVCCLQPSQSSITCLPQGFCPGGGLDDTYLTCASNLDCPNKGACTTVDAAAIAGIPLSYCAP